MKQKRNVRAPFVVTTAALVMACGGSVDSGAGSTGGDGGDAGAAGTSAGSGGTRSGSGGSSVGGSSVGGGSVGGSSTGGSSTGGSSVGGNGGSAGQGGFGGNPPPPPPPPNPAECPQSAPGAYDACPEELLGPIECSYRLDCQSGSYDVLFVCTPGGGWQVPENQRCAYESDSCPGTDVNCAGENWRMWTGTNPPPPCPEEKPEAYADCANDWGWGGSNVCGYFCPNGQWSIGSCAYQSAPVWLFDGACDGDCSHHERLLLDAVANAKYCQDSSECVVFPASGCNVVREHCSGAFYVNESQLDWDTVERALAELNACQGSANGCGGCAAEPPPAACIGGQCQAAP